MFLFKIGQFIYIDNGMHDDDLKGPLVYIYNGQIKKYYDGIKVI